MNLVYERYFGFTKAPFNITADPEFLFLSHSHREALAQLAYALKARRGFVVLTGEVGTGKTTVIHALLNELDEKMRTAFICSHIESPLNLLQYACDQFRIRVPKRSRSDVHEHLGLLNMFLLESYRRGENCALIIDEAQNLSVKVLESVRMLSNFETAKDKLLQILLVGQPEFINRLNSQELRQLKQRVTLHHNLRPLTLKECKAYVASRLQLAGGNPELFTSQAEEFIYQYSGGIPRVVNVICDNSLLTAYSLKKTLIDDAIVRQVAEDLNLSPMSPQNGQIQFRPSAQLDVMPGKQNGFHPAALEPTIAQTEPSEAIVEIPAPVQSPNPNILVPFFDRLNEELRQVIGPMASIVLQDHIRRGGYSKEAFPREKLDNLVETISEEIVNPFMRQEFRKKVDDRMREAKLVSYDL
jgi:type II secretory pathway predicted ATPase ExeA